MEASDRPHEWTRYSRVPAVRHTYLLPSGPPPTTGGERRHRHQADWRVGVVVEVQPHRPAIGAPFEPRCPRAGRSRQRSVLAPEAPGLAGTDPGVAPGVRLWFVRGPFFARAAFLGAFPALAWLPPTLPEAGLQGDLLLLAGPALGTLCGSGHASAPTLCRPTRSNCASRCHRSHT